MKKVLLYLPFESDFYKGLYQDIKKGFEEAGCIVEGGYQYLQSENLIKKIHEFQPDFVFEMNRTKDEIENFPKDLIHICWLVDYWERTPETIQGSDILYLFSKSWIKEHDSFNGKIVDVLYPGTNQSKYFITNENKSDKSMIFLGHMPKPWTKEELDRIVLKKDSKTIFFSEIVELIKKFTIYPEGYYCNFKYLEAKLKVESFKNKIDQTLYYDIDARAFREGRRYKVLADTIRSQIPIDIYGNDNWKLRDEFSSYYVKNLQSQTEMNNAFNKYTFLLHDTSYPHFRVFDAMAAGLIVTRSDCSKYGMADEWEELNFKEGSDVFTYQLDNIEEEINKLKNLSIDHIKDIQHSIRDKIINSHTWKHRALKVLNDIKKIKEL